MMKSNVLLTFCNKLIPQSDIIFQFILVDFGIFKINRITVHNHLVDVNLFKLK
jgi:hypothetical protein